MNNFTPLEQNLLQKKYEELEKKAQMSDLEKNLAIDETAFLHPAIDFLNEIGILGFRVKKKGNDNKLFEQNIFLTINK